MKLKLTLLTHTLVQSPHRENAGINREKNKQQGEKNKQNTGGASHGRGAS